jgi:hypothetical protein
VNTHRRWLTRVPGRVWCALAHRRHWKAMDTIYARGVTWDAWRCRRCWREWIYRRH